MLKTYLATFINIFAEIMNFALLARVILSWLPQAAHSKPAQIIKDVTDPFLKPLKRAIPPVGMMDISPIVAFFLIEIIRSALLYLITLLP
ncbi:YggT family protein [Candidatus Peregrinibacteria bacterium]|nr:YggT family protein [Candidatus Peregrinibacteria bacterium]